MGEHFSSIPQTPVCLGTGEGERGGGLLGFLSVQLSEHVEEFLIQVLGGVDHLGREREEGKLE
jgi:hypothetical protein